MTKDDLNTEEELTAFYDDRILPLESLARELAVSFFPVKFDSEVSSYFVDRESDSDYVYQFDPNNIGGELEILWGKGECPEIAELAVPLVELAERSREAKDTPDEVSPFIYAMF